MPVAKGYNYDIVASEGPDRRDIFSFWKNLVIEQNVKLIVCLVEVPNWACCQYWPKTNEQAIEDINAQEERIEVTLQNKEAINESLDCYNLVVRHYNGAEHQQVNVRLLNFLNWPDLGVPYSCDKGFIKTVELLTKFY